MAQGEHLQAHHGHLTRPNVIAIPPPSHDRAWLWTVPHLAVTSSGRGAREGGPGSQGPREGHRVVRGDLRAGADLERHEVGVRVTVTRTQRAENSKSAADPTLPFSPRESPEDFFWGSGELVLLVAGVGWTLSAMSHAALPG